MYQALTFPEFFADTMHRGMRHETEAVGVAFFLVFYMLSVYGICNLFICVILAAFELEDEEKENMQTSV